MTDYSIDVIYAYAQLGIDAGSSMQEIETVLTHASAYRFSTRERVDLIERLLEFFNSRNSFGSLEDSFEEVRKAYHRKAMAFHPDRHRGNKHAEEELKVINAAYAAVDEIHREARDYFRQSETSRSEAEQEARQTVDRETPDYIKSAHKKKTTSAEPPPKPADTAEPPRAMPAGARKYMAASVPRFVRNARLSHLPAKCIIGCWYIGRENDINVVYDIIMLPEIEFVRARGHLGTPDSAMPSLTRGKFTPPYIPQDIKQVIVPLDQPNPEHYARNYLRQEFAKQHQNFS